jgi:hypothetical protein
MTKLWAFENMDITIKTKLSNIKTPKLPGSVTPTSKTVWWRHVPGVCP